MSKTYHKQPPKKEPDEVLADKLYRKRKTEEKEKDLDDLDSRHRDDDVCER